MVRYCRLLDSGFDDSTHRSQSIVNPSTSNKKRSETVRNEEHGQDVV